MGAQFQIYNLILRRFPRAMYEELEQAGNRFASTIFALVSAWVKLSRIGSFSHGTKFYRSAGRGLGGSHLLPDSFYQPDEFGILSYVENAFVSCTKDIQVAVQYSGVGQRNPPFAILVMETGAVDRPCELGSELSQCVPSSVRRRLLILFLIRRYPGEGEWLWPPFSVVQPSGDSWVEVHRGEVVTM